MDTLVDSSVLIDLLRAESEFHTWAKAALAQQALEGDLLMNQIIAAEIRWSVSTPHALLAALVKPRDLPWAAAALAGEAHQQYRAAGGQREAILPDFLIGAHAAVESLALLTRDPRRVRAAFADVRLITPETSRV